MSAVSSGRASEARPDLVDRYLEVDDPTRKLRSGS
jgi:hypothetical protein